MEIFINDIGLIHEAAIKLDGLTVITGKNDSGKSTVGKTLYSLVDSLNHYSENIKTDAVRYIVNQIDEISDNLKQNNVKITERLEELRLELFFKKDTDDEDDLMIFSLKNNMDYPELTDKTQIVLDYLEAHIDEDAAVEQGYHMLKENYHHIKSPMFLHETKRRKIEAGFREMFQQQVFNFYSKKDGLIEVPEWNQLRVEFEKNRIQYLSSCEKATYNQFNDVIYIETPLIFNHAHRDKMLFLTDKAGYEDTLLQKLLYSKNSKTPNMFEEVLRSQQMELLDGKLAEVLSGSLKKTGNVWEELVYTLDGEELKIQNLATGLKTFMIIRRLLDNGYLEKGSLLIIDEPEVHLHPEWQLKFAELIVILMKTLKVTVLLATHSPYFLNAIEVFSKKYECVNETHYYLAERISEGAVFKNIDNNLNETYELLAEPFQTLEDILYE